MKKISVFEYAKYIKAAESASAFSLYDPAPIFRRTFSVKSPKKARIFVQSPLTAAPISTKMPNIFICPR